MQTFFQVCEILLNVLLAVACLIEGSSHKSWTSLGVNQRNYCQNHSSGNNAHLQLADISTRQNLCDEEVVQVAQRVECKSEEEDGTSLLSVCGVVVPQHQARQSCEDGDAQQEVQCCDSQQEWQEQERWDHGDLQVVNHCPKHRRLKATCV